jgi:hypothetical protein
MLDNDVEATGIVGHDAVNTGADQGTEVAAVVNRPDNKAQARLPGARGVDRIAPPEFRHEKILPRLDRHDRFSPDGKARPYPLSTLDGRRPGAQLYELRSLRIEGNVYEGMRGLVQALRFVT